MKPVVAKNLVKVFITKERKGFFKKGRTKKVVAVNHVSFDIGRGEIFGLLGPNGAGKTTTVKILSTLLLPDEGDAWVNGYHVVEEADKVRESIGVSLYSDRGFYWKLTGRENLTYFAYLYGMFPSEAKRRVEEVLRIVELEEEADKLVEEYSTGMKAKLNLARALLNDAPVLLLDEPTIGLDPRSARHIREVIVDLKKEGKAILLTTHNMEEADHLCDRMAIINRGRIIALGTPRELKEMVEKERILEVEVIGLGHRVLEKLRSLDSVKRVAATTMNSVAAKAKLKVVLNPDEGVGVPDVLNVLVKSGVKVLYARIAEPSLEDVFITLTGKTFEEEEAEAA